MLTSDLRGWAPAVLLAIGLMVSSAHADFAPDAEAARPLSVGARAPDFTADRGIIRFVYSNPDFRVRLGAEALWKAAAPFAPPPQRE